MSDQPLKREYPPNFEEICAVFPFVHDQKTTVFTYGDVIYTPGLKEGEELPANLLVHEQVHMRQQLDFSGGPKAWWEKYLKDINFRAGQEVEAYNAQYHFVKTNQGGSSRQLEKFLFALACDLSGPMYGNMMSYGRAESNIRRQI